MQTALDQALRAARLGVTAAWLAGCAGPSVTAVPASFAAVVERAAPAVVGIADARGPEDGKAPQAEPAIIGSGFRILDRSLIATAAHVVRALRGPPVVVWNARRWPARVRRVDPDSDLALLEIDDAAPMPGLALADAAAARPGDWVLVLGCPFGTLPTVTTGVVSGQPGAVLRPETLRHQIQINAAINPGNSGGPVINLGAEVIGVADATVVAGHGLGFAVPVAALRRLIERLDARP